MSSEAASAGSRCLLCGSTGHSLQARVRYDDIWRGLREIWHVELDRATRAALAPVDTTELVRCNACGLDRFEPMCPGDATFYRQLMSIVPYNEDRWEFGVVRERLRADDAVVDFGCGHGSFLRSLGRRPGRTVGIDHHRPSIERLTAAGFEAYDLPWSAFADGQPGAFDVVTCFHVVEHVRDPLDALRAARRCLAPTGRAFVSVPNRDRAFHYPEEPLDCPPHHVTRWATEQLHVLARRPGFRDDRIHYEPPDVSVRRVLLERAMVARLSLLPKQLVRPICRLWTRIAMGPRRHRRWVSEDLHVKHGVHGLSIMAELVLDDGRAPQ